MAGTQPGKTRRSPDGPARRAVGGRAGAQLLAGSEQPPAPPGRIARYAWGDDYHDLIEGKLRALDAFLQTHGGQQRYYVDTGPVLERDFAAEAGAGWHGKSTMLLHPELGTWFFLAELLTTLALEPDAPDPPALRKLHALSRRLPDRRDPPRPALPPRRAAVHFLPDHRAQGADPARTASPARRPHLRLRRLPRRLPVEPFRAGQPRGGVPGAAGHGGACRCGIFWRMTQEDFSAAFKGSPIKRTKRRGLLRNVCVALGNVGTADDLPALERGRRRRRGTHRRTRPLGHRTHPRTGGIAVHDGPAARGASSARASAG